MKLLTFADVEKGARLGVALDDRVYDLQRVAAQYGVALPADMLSLLQLGKPGLETAQSLVEAIGEDRLPGMPLARTRLLAPILRPPKILALAGNYVEHVRESGWQMPDKTGVTPRVFMKPATAVIGPDAPIIAPRLTKELDYELEMAAVIGTPCKDVSAAHALDYVAGYMVFNDVSARSLTVAEGRTVRPWDDFFDWLNGKWFDTFAAMGPYLVTADEVGDPQALDMKLTVNGEVRQDATTAMMVFSVAELVAWCAQFMTLEPGDIIATGTPSGVGKARGIFLQPGDVVEGTIARLGTLRNPVAAG